MEHFSEREEKIIKLIGRRKVKIRQLTGELFEGERFIPIDPEISVANCVSRIIKKCKHYSLNWTLEKTKDNNKLVVKRVKQ